MASSETPKDRDSGTYKPTDLPGAPEIEDLGSANEETLTGPKLQQSYLPNRQAMLAALRVVLGLPRVIPSSGPDDLLSEAK